VLFIFVPPSMVDVKEVENGLRRVAPLFRSNKKTLLICFMGHKGFPPKSAHPVNMSPATCSRKAPFRINESGGIFRTVGAVRKTVAAEDARY